jgi:hypothetical protein
MRVGNRGMERCAAVSAGSRGKARGAAWAVPAWPGHAVVTDVRPDVRTLLLPLTNWYRITGDGIGSSGVLRPEARNGSSACP